MAVGGLLLTDRGHIPQRTCVGCRAIVPKRELVRLVQGGRGAYVHPRETCIEVAVRGGAQRSLRRPIAAEEIRRTIIKNSASLRPAEEVETAVYTGVPGTHRSEEG